MKTVVQYISNDGKVFDDRQACLQYEAKKDLSDSIKAHFYESGYETFNDWVNRDAFFEWLETNEDLVQTYLKTF